RRNAGIGRTVLLLARGVPAVAARRIDELSVPVGNRRDRAFVGRVGRGRLLAISEIFLGRHVELGRQTDRGRTVPGRNGAAVSRNSSGGASLGRDVDRSAVRGGVGGGRGSDAF